ncbi:MAG: response regulator transcription factor [Anaerolineales bacterium]|nr:response regulator transcription factor [Anaerolineales bacterium]
MKALVVDDDLALADVVSFTLRKAGFEVIMAHDGQVALDRWRTESPDLIILDLNLPKLDGFGVCRQIRAQDDTPIIILSVRGEEDDIVTGLKLGADDYIVKPFSPRQMVARVEAVLRRVGDVHPSPGNLTVGDITLDLSRCKVSCSQQLIAKLTPLECRLLEILMMNRDQVVLADALIDQVWGPQGGDKDMLKQLVYRLRHKIEICPSRLMYIETVSGVGYSLIFTSENK